MKSRFMILAVLAALLAIGVGAYFLLSDDSSDVGSTNNSTATNNQEQPTTGLGQDDVEKAVESHERWLDAFFAGDADTACELVTDNYTNEVAQQEDSPDDCKGQVSQGSAIAAAFGVDTSELTSTGRIEDNKIIVTSKWSSGESSDYVMVRENGVWKTDSEIKVVSEEQKQQEEYNAAVEEWNALSQDERDSWYNEDGTGGFDAYAKNKGVAAE